MARPIKETPILFGEDARRFEARMQQVRKETPEEKQARMEAYNIVTDNKTGCRFLTVDAYADAIPFYLKNGFIPLNEDDVGQATRLLFFDLSDIADTE